MQSCTQQTKPGKTPSFFDSDNQHVTRKSGSSPSSFRVSSRTTSWGQVQKRSIFHVDPLEWALEVSGRVGLANAAADPVRLVAASTRLGSGFVLFDPNVSQWTTRTPNTTATLLVSRCWIMRVATYRQQHTVCNRHMLSGW
jgi:hypothetical protein